MLNQLDSETAETYGWEMVNCLSRREAKDENNLGEMFLQEEESGVINDNVFFGSSLMEENNEMLYTPICDSKLSFPGELTENEDSIDLNDFLPVQ